MSLPKNETTVNVKSASFVIIRLLHKGLIHIHSHSHIYIHSSFALRASLFNIIVTAYSSHFSLKCCLGWLPPLFYQLCGIEELKARVYNPGELARELARFEIGTSSEFHPPSPPHQCSVQSHSPTNLNVHLLVGLSREKEMPEQDTAIQLNLARSRQEVKRQNNKLHPLTFQNKTCHLDTSTHREASCLP